MPVDTPNGNRQPAGSSKTPSSESKPRGANRSTKVAGKLQVLPEQPDVPTQSKVLQEPSEPKPPSKPQETVPVEPTSASTVESDEEDADDEEDFEEQDAEVCRKLFFMHPRMAHVNHTFNYRFTLRLLKFPKERREEMRCV